MTLFAYEKSAEAIYRQSFATIEAEADLSAFAPADRPVALRMIHACGQVDLAQDIVMRPGACRAGAAALRHGAPILCDSAMVAAGVVRTVKSPKIVEIGTPATAARATRLATTRSAAQVDGWLPDLAGSIVLIGNAPTALFRLLELLHQHPEARPALLIACPVGFVGAVESKRALVTQAPDIPYVTVRGRRGGTPIAAAALNACALVKAP